MERIESPVAAGPMICWAANLKLQGSKRKIKNLLTVNFNLKGSVFFSL
jgi:hypothetical protein